MASKIKPGTKHPSKPGLVMGTKSRYVSKSTYAKQLKAGAAKPLPSKGGALVKRPSSAITTTKSKPSAKTVKALPPSKKGGPIQKTRVRRSNINKPPTNKTQMGTKGGGIKPQLRLPSAGKTAVNALKRAAKITKAKSVATSAGSKLGGIGLALSGIATAQDLAASLKRGEGYASLPGHISKAIKGNKKNKSTSKQKTNKRGRRTNSASSKTEVKPASKNPSKYPTKAVTKTVKKGRDYQAEAKAEAAKKKAPSSSNPPVSKIPNPPAKNRMKDASASSRMAAWAKANRKMIEKSGTKKQKEILAKLDKKKNNPPQSAANKAGYPGNRNY